MRRRMLASIGGATWKNPYVTDGLVAMWDGEWNVSGGVHDQNAVSWRDVVGGEILSPYVSVRPTVGSNSVTVPEGTFLSTREAFADIAASRECTIEIVAQFFQADESAQFAVHIGLPSVTSIPTLGMLCQWVKWGWSNVGVVYNTNDGFSSGLNSSSCVYGGDLLQTYYNGDFRSVIGCYSQVAAGGHLILGDVAWGSPARQAITYHCVRIYDRAISNFDVAVNYAIDKARFGLP